jgi:hypothetical protein
MHDRTGKPLKIGDHVTIHAKIVELSPTEEYCNVSLETIFGRKPDRWFGIPPHLIGDLTRSTNNNIEQHQEFVTYCLRAWLVRWELEIRRKLFSSADQAAGYYAKERISAINTAVLDLVEIPF